MSFVVTDFDTSRMLIYEFLLLINNNIPILHRFRDIAFDMSKIAIFGYPSCVRPPPRLRDSPGTISAKFSVDVIGCQGMKNAVEILPKISTA